MEKELEAGHSLTQRLAGKGQSTAAGELGRSVKSGSIEKTMGQATGSGVSLPGRVALGRILDLSNLCFTFLFSGNREMS